MQRPPPLPPDVIRVRAMSMIGVMRIAQPIEPKPLPFPSRAHAGEVRERSTLGLMSYEVTIAAVRKGPVFSVPLVVQEKFRTCTYFVLETITLPMVKQRRTHHEYIC